MFAIPGILGILFFVYLRPQEAIEQLQGIPFLYLFFGLMLFGAAVDLRLRVTKAIAIPALPWAVLFVVWSLFSVAIMKPDQIMMLMIELFITVGIFVLIAQSIQTFRMFEVVASMLIALAMILTAIAIHQGMSPHQCVVAPKGGGSAAAEAGVPDGRPCVKAWTCYNEDSEPGADYYCEKVGVLGTHSVSNRVRYRGILQDPNELAIALSSGLALLLALWIRSGRRFWAIMAFVGIIGVGWAVKMTGSRSGQLGFLAACVAFLYWKYGKKLLVILGPVMLPVLAVVAAGGSDRGDADESSAERYEAWRTGFDMFRGSPVWGVGYGQFNDYHFLTAHNTYVLVVAELGIVGIFIFSMLLWTSMKTPITALKRFKGHPEARVAELWSVALLASMIAILSGCMFLSFAYHQILWIFLGMAGALYICIKRHDPEFEVKIGFIDYVVVFGVDIVLFFGLQLYLKSKGH